MFQVNPPFFSKNFTESSDGAVEPLVSKQRAHHFSYSTVIGDRNTPQVSADARNETTDYARIPGFSSRSTPSGLEGFPPSLVEALSYYSCRLHGIVVPNV